MRRFVAGLFVVLILGASGAPVGAEPLPDYCTDVWAPGDPPDSPSATACTPW